MTRARAIERVLDLARWAPSGDNTQIWRFEVVGDHHAVIHGFDTRDHCVYDLDGRPSQIAIGALLETAAIAATAEGWRMRAERRMHMPETHPTFDLLFSSDSTVQPDPLVDAIARRSVQRRRMQTRKLTEVEKSALQSSVGSEFAIHWIEGRADRLQMALLLFRSAKIRLAMPEAYRVHCDVIEWNSRYSVSRVPDLALGVDWLSLKLMRFAMKSWARVKFFNTYFAGTWIPRIQMDFLPGIACGAHFVILAHRSPETVDDFVAAGRAVQRFWLTATRLGLQLQPELTPLIFSRYSRDAITFSGTPGTSALASQVADRLDQVSGSDCSKLGVFMGRVGAGSPPKARSLRLDLDTLLDRRPQSHGAQKASNR